MPLVVSLLAAHVAFSAAAESPVRRVPEFSREADKNEMAVRRHVAKTEDRTTVVQIAAGVDRSPMRRERIVRDGFDGVSYWDAYQGELRVDQAMFNISAPGKPLKEFYLGAVFQAATAMMLPAKKSDLGKHCFNYAKILAGEFYTESGEYADSLGLLPGKAPKNSMAAAAAADLASDWDAVDKVDSGRVTWDAFVNFYVGKYESRLEKAKEGEEREVVIASFKNYLGTLFFAGRMMMLQAPGGKFNLGTLGQHCFSYAGLMAGEFYFPGGPKDALALKDVVTDDWKKAHENRRVRGEEFVALLAPDSGLKSIYFNAVFSTAVAMMLPARKDDIGKHCFSYAVILANEFYPEDGTAPDLLGLTKGPITDSETRERVRLDLNEDWDAVEKDSEKRVSLDAFTKYYSQKYNNRSGDFMAFLERCFMSGRLMMAQVPSLNKGTLGGHCFRYAGLMAGEFYFNGKPKNALNL